MSRTLLSQYKLAAFMADTYDTKTHYNVTKDWRPTHICEREAKNTQVCQYITIHYWLNIKIDYCHGSTDDGKHTKNSEFIRLMQNPVILVPCEFAQLTVNKPRF